MPCGLLSYLACPCAAPSDGDVRSIYVYMHGLLLPYVCSLQAIGPYTPLHAWRTSLRLASLHLALNHFILFFSFGFHSVLLPLLLCIATYITISDILCLFSPTLFIFAFATLDVYKIGDFYGLWVMKSFTVEAILDPCRAS